MSDVRRYYFYRSDRVSYDAVSSYKGNPTEEYVLASDYNTSEAARKEAEAKVAWCSGEIATLVTERDALAATVERVKNWRDDPYICGEIYLKGLDAALTPLAGSPSPIPPCACGDDTVLGTHSKMGCHVERVPKVGATERGASFTTSTDAFPGPRGATDRTFVAEGRDSTERRVKQAEAFSVQGDSGLIFPNWIKHYHRSGVLTRAGRRGE